MSENWISVTPDGGDLKISCTEENSSKYRTGNILLTQNETSAKKSIEVSQLGSDERPVFERTIVIQFGGDVTVSTGSVVMEFGDDLEVISGDCSANGQTLTIPVNGSEKSVKIRTHSVPLVTKIYWSLTAQENVPVDLWLNGYSAALHESLQFEEGHYADVSAFSLPTEPTYLKFMLNTTSEYDTTLSITFPGYLTSYNSEIIVYFDGDLTNAELEEETENVYFLFQQMHPKQIMLRYTKEETDNWQNADIGELTVGVKLTLPTWPIALQRVSIDINGEKKSDVSLVDHTTVKFDVSSMDTWKTFNIDLATTHTPTERPPGNNNEDQEEENDYYGYSFSFSNTISIMHWLLDVSYIIMDIDDPLNSIQTPLQNGFYDTSHGSIVLNGDYTMSEATEVVSALSVTGVNNYNKLYDLLKGRDIQTAQHAYESYQAHAQIPETVETGYTANP